MRYELWKLGQAAAAFWLIPFIPFVAALWFLGFWGLIMLGWTISWYIWLLGDADENSSA